MPLSRSGAAGYFGLAGSISGSMGPPGPVGRGPVATMLKVLPRVRQCHRRLSLGWPLGSIERRPSETLPGLACLAHPWPRLGQHGGTMPSLLSGPTSRRVGVSLHATPAGKRSLQATRTQSASPPISWPLMAVVGGVVTALASWILCAGVAVLGWLAAEPGSSWRCAADRHSALVAEQWRRGALAISRSRWCPGARLR